MPLSLNIVTGSKDRSAFVETGDWTAGLQEQLNDILDRLRRLEAGSVPDRRPARLHTVGELLLARRQRDALFEPGLFADPSWDILLELYRSELEEKPLFLLRLGETCRHPQTTVLRHVERLEAAGLVERTDPSTASKRVYVRLTTRGCRAMQSFIDGRLSAAR
jgi:DNA-binding MarR family transcriptional regulator